MRVLLIGGSKSGKSMFAQRLSVRLAQGAPMLYWATMISTDAEDQSRINNHLRERDGWGFTTIECPRNVTAAAKQVPADATILFDSITAVLANEMFGDTVDETAALRTANDLLTLSRMSANFILVGDDVFRDSIIYGDLTEAYRRSMAYICRRAAAEFDAVYELVGGLPKLWKGTFV